MLTDIRDSERIKIQFRGSVADTESKTADTSRFKVELELTENEADCLLNCFSYVGKTLGNNLRREQMSVIAMLYVRLTDIFPSLIASESVMSFWEHHSQSFADAALGSMPAPMECVSRQGTRDVQPIREYINAELAKLNKRQECIQARYIREVLGLYGRYATDRQCPVEVTRRLNADTEYRLITERKRRLQSELAKTSEGNSR